VGATLYRSDPGAEARRNGGAARVDKGAIAGIFVNSEEQTNREGEDDELVCQPCDRAFVDSSGAPILRARKRSRCMRTTRRMSTLRN
jgi:hypothetical protein